MKEIYYYIRDKEKRPMITICLMKEDNYNTLSNPYATTYGRINISKGVALCSEKDIPCKKVGRKIARERAFYALSEERDSCMVNREELIKLFPPFKSCYMPVLTEYETKLLNFDDTF